MSKKTKHEWKWISDTSYLHPERWQAGVYGKLALSKEENYYLVESDGMVHEVPRRWARREHGQWIMGLPPGPDRLALADEYAHLIRFLENRRGEKRKRDRESGLVLVLVAVLLPVLLVLGFFLLEIGLLMVARGQAQNCVDSSVLAGAGNMGRQYSEIESCEDRQDFTPDEGEIREAGHSMLTANGCTGEITIQGFRIGSVAFKTKPRIVWSETTVRAEASAALLVDPGGPVPCRNPDGEEPEISGRKWFIARLVK